ncbi:hypothetical protein KVR01_007330 [Diaporthe batatas]|uniref:uncharacterized protein n=1 Tax=Diaporthe batatas TaxID=748121 RepID=UPI001D050178|nr:uncharacterized protein KVR01_007330 [Diaporthe batatas]KAG8162852.1 hypothetical protein KVR01_007330 [Diaporthe batatas]
MDVQQQLERNEYLMCRPRAPSTNAAVFTEMDGPMRTTQSDPASVHIERLERFDSEKESRRQHQISIEMWKEADEEITQLFVLMAECTWDQVMGEVHSLSVRWSTNPKKASKSVVYLEKIGKNSDALKAWLDLLPEGDYGSSICGIFTLAIGAVGAFTKVETIILETLSEIPEVMDDAKRYIEIYGIYRDQRLERKTFELYLSILTALKHIMQFFADSSWSKVYQPILKQQSYKSDLIESCNDIRLKAKRVKNEAQICMQERNVNLNEAFHLQQATLDDLNEKADRILATSNIYYQLIRELEIQFRHSCAAKHPQVAKDKRLSEYEHKRDLERAKDLLEVLSYDPDIVLRDTMTCLHLGAALEEAGKARAAALIRNPIFKAFLTKSASSGTLLINGNEDISNAEGVSPLSLVAARLAQISEHNETTQGLTLRYFCAEHSPYGKVLTGQLVSHMVSRSVAIDLSFLGHGDCDVLGKLNLKLMCTAFFKLVKQLPSGTVILCILDEAALYETDVE